MAAGPVVDGIDSGKVQPRAAATPSSEKLLPTRSAWSLRHDSHEDTRRTAPGAPRTLAHGASPSQRSTSRIRAERPNACRLVPLPLIRRSMAFAVG